MGSCLQHTHTKKTPEYTPVVDMAGVEPRKARGLSGWLEVPLCFYAWVKEGKEYIFWGETGGHGIAMTWTVRFFFQKILYIRFLKSRIGTQQCPFMHVLSVSVLMLCDKAQSYNRDCVAHRAENIHLGPEEKVCWPFLNDWASQALTLSSCF